MNIAQQALPLPDITNWCTRAAAARRLGVDESTVSRWIKKGKITAYAPRCAPRERPPILLLCADVDRFHAARQLVTGKPGTPPGG